MPQKNTLIIGCGRLGASIAHQLSENTQNVVIVDKSELAFKKLSPSFGGITIVGDATQINVLREAEIHNTETAIVVTDIDNVNLLVGQLISHHYDVEEVIIRLADPELEETYKDKDFRIVCPTDLTTAEVLNMWQGGDLDE